MRVWYFVCLTSNLLAKAVQEYVGAKAVGTRVEAALGSADGRAKTGIKGRTARSWLKAMGYDFRQAQKGIYVDGHERPDVVEYRQKSFLPTLDQYRPYLAQWVDGQLVEGPSPASDGRWVVVVSHDESGFTVNDGRRHMWLQKGKNPLRPKGMGKGIMVSDFLTPVGRLRAPETITADQLKATGLRRNAAELLEYGQGNYWTGEKMVRQTIDFAIPLFELAFPPSHFRALFIFDNSCNHRVMAGDALVASKMNLGPGGKQPAMRPGWFGSPPNAQPMVDEANKPKSIKRVLQERGLWPPQGLHLSCPTKAHSGNACCARKLLASQPDFQAQVGLVQEAVERRGHAALFLPKFHPELNYIEYFWGQAKRYAREHCTYTLAGLRATVPDALESVSGETIHKFYQRILRIGDAYAAGFKLGTAQYTDRVYRSHRAAVWKE
jgi:transposase